MSDSKMDLPHSVGIMTDQELADYCHIQNCTASPLVAEFVRRIEAQQSDEWETEEVRAIFKGYCYSLDVGIQIEVAKEQVMELVEDSDDVDTIGGIFDGLYAGIQSTELFSPEFGLGEAAYEQASHIQQPKPRKSVVKKSSKPGPKEIYLPSILHVLREHKLPLQRKDLVASVLQRVSEGNVRAIYKSIAKAVSDRLILKIGSNRFQMPKDA